jgi:hypothetical protein
MTYTKEIEEWLAVRKLEALKIDPGTAELSWCYAETMDPYGVAPDLPEELQQVGREYFARRPDGDKWIWFGDLPDDVREKLWERYGRKLAFPAGLEDLAAAASGSPDSSPVVDVEPRDETKSSAALADPLARASEAPTRMTMIEIADADARPRAMLRRHDRETRSLIFLGKVAGTVSKALAPLADELRKDMHDDVIVRVRGTWSRFEVINICLDIHGHPRCHGGGRQHSVLESRWRVRPIRSNDATTTGVCPLEGRTMRRGTPA